MRKKPEMRIDPKNEYLPKSREEKQFVKAFSTLSKDQEAANFLRDLLTPAELEEFANRLEIARLLSLRKLSYLEIADKVGTSTTTVTRVAQWLFRGCGGYVNVLSRLKNTVVTV
jgi:TrpR-related protein YerC/YecD